MYNQSSEMCLINNTPIPLLLVESMPLFELWSYSRLSVPQKLYKYCPDTDDSESGKNFSRENLSSGCVYMQSPIEFDDIYDSDIRIGFQDYEFARLKVYCERFGISLPGADELSCDYLVLALAEELDSLRQNHRLRCDYLDTKFETEIAEKSNRLFLTYFMKMNNEGKTAKEAIIEAIHYEYKVYKNWLKEMFRVSCFATTPYSQLMWAMYANKHTGFCVEYDIRRQDKKYDEVFKNLFPVIYCMSRNNPSKRIISEKDSGYSADHIAEIFIYGLLRKSIDWSFQNEWRLVLPNRQSNEKDGFLIPFYPVSCVYLGSRMSKKRRAEIIEICEKKRIRYVDVIPDDKEFRMTERE